MTQALTFATSSFRQSEFDFSDAGDGGENVACNLNICQWQCRQVFNKDQVTRSRTRAKHATCCPKNIFKQASEPGMRRYALLQQAAQDGSGQPPVAMHFVAAALPWPRPLWTAAWSCSGKRWRKKLFSLLLDPCDCRDGPAQEDRQDLRVQMSCRRWHVRPDQSSCKKAGQPLSKLRIVVAGIKMHN